MKKQLFAIAVLTVLVFTGTAYASHQPNHNPPGQTEPENKLSVCHPVNGEGETKAGWTIIEPDKASSHIDEAEYNKVPKGEYWKHESKDGRHDTYADAQGNCPTVPNDPPVVVDVCENIEGNQAVTPPGYIQKDKICVRADEPKSDPEPDYPAWEPTADGGMRDPSTGEVFYGK